ncbi:MAG: NTP transferase domain-containing protein [Nocardioides sp.]|uniref:NTP transferase domain-containing protein n=1 Tax=Nocardioides sp. TaxID=35761 RepID=UPI0039E524A4
MEDWTLVVPVRDPRTGKSRLGLGPEVAETIARRTLDAAGATARVARLLLVTDEPCWTVGVAAEVVVERSPGLTVAVRAGLEAAGTDRVAVMLGDVPTLTPDELEVALAAADEVRRGMVSDHVGTGTVLITALDAATHRPAFGPDSAARHRAAGYLELPVPADSGLRLDVDTLEDLRLASARGRWEQAS